MEMRLELVPVPVTDLDRAKAFYVDVLGFTLDHDIQPGGPMRLMQLTPPGSACSILISTGLPGMDTPAGTLRGLHLVVPDVAKVRETLAGRGVDVGAIDDMGGVLYVSFSDPDGNTWLLQEITANAQRPS